MSQKIGERELQLRAMREQGAKTKATLPATSGRKPVKKKRKATLHLATPSARGRVGGAV